MIMIKRRQFIRLGVLLFLLAGKAAFTSGALYAQAPVSLDEAIRSGAQEIEAKLPKGNHVVVLNFKSASQRLSDYVLDEMMTVLVKSGKLTVVDRANLELIRQEMDFQMSGEVSDSSAQAIGHKLGAQSIISGSIEDIGSNYRIRFRTIEVVTAAIQVLSSMNVKKDNQIMVLMGGGGSGIATTQYPNGLNFSTGRKVGAGFLNWIYGLGSFTMGDWGGGLIVGGIELTGSIISVIGLIGTETTDEYGFAYYEPNYFVMLGGLAVVLAGVIYGHIRPFTYDKALAKKNGTYYSFEESNPLYHITVAPMPSQNNMGLSLLYSVSY